MYIDIREVVIYFGAEGGRAMVAFFMRHKNMISIFCLSMNASFFGGGRYAFSLLSVEIKAG
jgi:hypothetical protein